MRGFQNNRSCGTLASLFVLAIVAMCPLFGCAGMRQPDPAESQPWICCPEHAAAEGVFGGSLYFVDSRGSIEWRSANATKSVARSTDAVKRAVQFYGGLDNVLNTSVVQLRRKLERAGAFSDRVVGERTFAIVCVEPLVVLTLMQRTAAIVWARPGDYRMEYSSTPDPHFELPYGFAYGTRYPWAEVIEWFSPDMNVKPRPLEFNDGVGRIDVPWGALLVRREGDELVIDAVGKEAAP